LAISTGKWRSGDQHGKMVNWRSARENGEVAISTEKNGEVVISTGKW